MLKLKVLIGPNAGETIDLGEGETSVGRQPGNGIVLPSTQISKRHCVLVVDNSQVSVRDEGSSNGTFVNGALVKSKKLKPGDKVSVGDVVLQLVKVVKKKQEFSKLTRPPQERQSGNIVAFPGGIGSGLPTFQQGEFNSSPSDPAVNFRAQPRELKEKVDFAFKNTIMTFFYNLNLKNEWSLMGKGILFTLALLSVLVAVYPITEASRNLVVREIGRRALYMARQIADHNEPLLAAGNETKTDILGVDQKRGVKLAVITDLNQRVIAPATLLNNYLTSGPAAKVAVKIKAKFISGQEPKGEWRISDGLLVAVEPVAILNPAAGKNTVIGMSVVSLDLEDSAPALSELGLFYLQGFALSAGIAILLWAILYQLTLRPLQVLSDDLDRALKGELKSVTKEYQFSELNTLFESIDTLVNRAQNNGAASGGVTASASGISAQDLLGVASLLGSAEKFGVLLADQERRVIYLNGRFSDVASVRQADAIGQTLAQAAPDRGFEAFVEDLFNRSGPGDGVTETYDFNGVVYQVQVAGFGSPGSAASAFLFFLMKVEE